MFRNRYGITYARWEKALMCLGLLTALFGLIRTPLEWARSGAIQSFGPTFGIAIAGVLVVLWCLLRAMKRRIAQLSQKGNK